MVETIWHWTTFVRSASLLMYFKEDILNASWVGNILCVQATNEIFALFILNQNPYLHISVESWVPKAYNEEPILL